MVVTSIQTWRSWLRTTYPGYVPEETNCRRNFVLQGVHEQAGPSGCRG
jgi:hypothetical protein